jgi:DNA-binding GntR family transcriptional regulator
MTRKETRMPKPGRTPADPPPGPPPALPAGVRVKQVLHRAIVTGAIPGGTRLVQSRIARELGVSTQPVRDALRELAAEGFVRLDDRAVAVVRELSQSEVVDIYEILKMLEPVATARAARLASEQSVLRAVELLAAMKSERDSLRWADHHARFHTVLDGASGSPRLAAILNNLREVSALYVTHSILAAPQRIQCANAEHEEILRAVMGRDPAAAADAALHHLDGRLSGLLDVHEICPPSSGGAAGRPA